MNKIRAFTCDGEDKRVQDVLSQLGFIARIQPKEKIDIETLSIMPDNWKTSLYRTLIARRESKEATLEFIRTVFEKAVDLAFKYSEEESELGEDVTDKIIQGITAARGGVENMCQTYRQDRMYCSRVDSMVQVVQTKLSLLSKDVQIPAREYRNPEESSEDLSSEVIVNQ